MKILRDERGSITILFTFILIVLIGIMGLVIDVGNAYVEKGKLQNAIDAAVLAGAQELPNTTDAYNVALDYINLNDVASSDVTIDVSASKLTIEANKEVSTYFIRIFGIEFMDVGTRAVAALGDADPVFDHTLYSGSDEETLNLNGSNILVDGTAHSNERIIVNGYNIDVTVAASAVSTIRTNGSNIDIPTRLPNSSYIGMPDYMEEVEAQALSSGEHYSSSQTYNGNNVEVGDSIYVDGEVKLNGTTINGAGTILATDKITLNGNMINTSASDQVCLYSGGDIIINGNSITVEGILYAPFGRVILNGNNITVNGRIIGLEAVLNGNDIQINGSDVEIKSLPSTGIKLVE